MIVGKSCSSWLFINTDKGLGADVGHPGPGVAKPSVTGLVFSYDEAATRYAALTDIQRPRVEIIESLERMMEKSLRHFIELRKIPPRRVIFFRDGVSEGEYNTVATAELAAIQGTLMSVTFCLTYRTFSFFSFSCHPDHCRGSGLSNPCDVHHCRQTVCVSFYRSLDIDKYGV